MSVPASLSDFEARLKESIDPVRFPSVAYGISRGNETLLLGAHGLANKETGQQATPQTPYSLASVTKPMTTTAIMLLAHRGLIDLHRPANDYLGEAKIQSRAGDANEATVWRVADHTAGLPLHYQFYYEDEPYTRPPMDETIRRYAKTFTPPGERHHYSNLGYGILDHLVEHLSGQSYRDFMANEIFGPLGMANSAIGAQDGAAIAYGPDGVGYPRYTFDHPGGSEAFCSVEDLLTFGRFHLQDSAKLFPNERRLEMQRRTAQDQNRGYGFGWGISEDRLGFRMVGHTGGMGGVNTILRMVPELDLVIAILINGQGDLPFRAADDALAALDPGFRERLTAERENPAPETPPLKVPSHLWGRYEGRIETHEGGVPFTLDIGDDEYATAVVGGGEAPVEELQMRGEYLLGVFDGNVGTADAGRRDYRIHLDLKPVTGGLEGAAVTISRMENGGGGAPDKRMGNALAYWTRLSK